MTAIRRRIVPIRLSEEEYDTIYRNAMAQGFEHPTGGRITGPNLAAYIRAAAVKGMGKKSTGR